MGRVDSLGKLTRISHCAPHRLAPHRDRRRIHALYRQKRTIRVAVVWRPEHDKETAEMARSVILLRLERNGGYQRAVRLRSAQPILI